MKIVVERAAQDSLFKSCGFFHSEGPQGRNFKSLPLSEAKGAEVALPKQLGQSLSCSNSAALANARASSPRVLLLHPRQQEARTFRLSYPGARVSISMRVSGDRWAG